MIKLLDKPFDGSFPNDGNKEVCLNRLEHKEGTFLIKRHYQRIIRCNEMIESHAGGIFGLYND